MAQPPIHPGYHIEVEEALNLSPIRAAQQPGMPRHRLAGIIQGGHGILADTSLRPGTWLKTSPELWMNLHTTSGSTSCSKSGARRLGSKFQQATVCARA